METVKWIIQDDNPSTTSTFLSLDRVSKAIEAASGGRFIIQANEGGAIVPADTEIEAVQRGVLDGASNGPILWVGDLPDAPPFSTTVGGPTAFQYYMWYMYGEGLALMKEMFDTGGFENVKPIATLAREPETFLYTNYVVNSPDDLDGKKMRLLGDEAEIFGPLGVAAVATPSPELYEALQRGVIDGFQHSSLAVDLNFGFQEIVDYAYVSPARQPTDVYVYIVNEQSWADLPNDLKWIFTELVWAEGVRHYAEWTFKNTTATAEWISSGVTVAPIPQSVEDVIVQNSNEFYAKRQAANPFYDRLIKSLFNWRDAYAATYPRL
jgi:TRAP-type mannitol/chloroaromatic compound transport system substrate-binding protein